MNAWTRFATCTTACKSQRKTWHTYSGWTRSAVRAALPLRGMTRHGRGDTKCGDDGTNGNRFGLARLGACGGS
eukprot:5248205-Pleurochrysis_carterae.AAC.1